MLGSSIGVKDADGFQPLERQAFGAAAEDADASADFFTGKPRVDGLGHAFLFRNYRPELGKWQTADPIGYPDGWNNFAYVNNWVVGSLDRFGLDIWHIVDSRAVGGLGHSAMIVGNSQTGYDFYSYGPTVDNPSFTNVPVTHIHAQTFHHLVAELQTTRMTDGIYPYDRWQRWDTSTMIDQLAREGIMQSHGTDYHLFFNNCWDAVWRALDIAGVPLATAFTHSPNENFARNVNQGVVDAYNYSDTTLSVPE